ncbi:MAG TPA: NADH dehydrogenase subunit, partial [bacterium]|nr:NADH dehydrogenase subunit [bacterium]
MSAIVDMIRKAGVVGAGGAGFPAHIKAGSTVDTVIANGAECEPLIHK